MVRMLSLRVRCRHFERTHVNCTISGLAETSVIYSHIILYTYSPKENPNVRLFRKCQAREYTTKQTINALEDLDRALLSILWQRGRLGDLKINKDGSVHNRQQRRDDRRKTHSWLAGGIHDTQAGEQARV